MTDYVTLSAVKLALGASETTDDTLLTSLITEASRIVDRHCAGAVNSDNYFARETVTNQTVKGLVSADGKLYCFPLKPTVESVSALFYRLSPRETWLDLAAEYAEITAYSVSIWGVPSGRGDVQVQISYVGGFAVIPADVQNAVTLLSVRLYREIKSGVTDSIGVAELGTLQYTKALPARAVELLKPYKRVV